MAQNPLKKTKKALNIRESHWNIEMETKLSRDDVRWLDIFQSKQQLLPASLQFYTTQIKHEKTHTVAEKKVYNQSLNFFLKLPLIL